MARPSFLRGGLIALVAAVFLAASGAFGTTETPFLVRLGYWVLTIGAGAGVGVPLARFLASRDLFRSPVLGVLLITICLGGPLTLMSWALSGWIFHAGLDPHTLPGFAVPVLLVTACMSTLNVLAGRQPRLTHAPAPDGPSPPRAVAFLDRIPPRLRGGTLLAVQAEDHYLRLHTTAGSDLILMRLSDAIAELDGVEGAQTHRSWWVAKDAVQDADKGDGRAVLKLSGGVEAPVSRTYAKALRDAGWF